jgi:hypothetical protein
MWTGKTGFSELYFEIPLLYAEFNNIYLATVCYCYMIDLGSHTVIPFALPFFFIFFKLIITIIFW